ncbi:hypothetical protein ES708_29490 [subsurface metagenome]
MDVENEIKELTLFARITKKRLDKLERQRIEVLEDRVKLLESRNRALQAQANITRDRFARLEEECLSYEVRLDKLEGK